MIEKENCRRGNAVMEFKVLRVPCYLVIVLKERGTGEIGAAPNRSREELADTMNNPNHPGL
jgi:hypothetical protein